MGAKRFGELVGWMGERTEVKRLPSHYHKCSTWSTTGARIA
jgi:hypothetical protein